MNLIDNLMKTGLTKHESQLYVALCREGNLTGYEAAKITGIPRANTYQALAGLVEKGGAYIIEGAVQKYMAIAVEEYCTNIIRGMEQIIKEIKRECPIKRMALEPYITITGLNHIVDKMKNIINNAKERIYVSLAEQELPYIKDELIGAAKRGLKVVVIAAKKVEIPDIVIHKIQKSSGQIRLIADTSHVLTGELSGKETDSCLYSKNRPLVELIKDSLKNEIRLAEIEEGK